MFNAYSNPYMQPQMQRYQQPYQPYANTSPVQPQSVQNYAQPVQVQGLQGKSVDSLDVVKAMDIPLDGSISYFPLIDGSAIVTKQLQQDGTSKTLIYKPVDDKESEKPQIKYVTEDEMNEAIKNINIDNEDIDDIKEELKTLKKQIRNLTDSKKKEE